ncbi:MAG TPA: hypothetical protein VF920_14715, partial [Dongiaceae bacterium]
MMGLLRRLFASQSLQSKLMARLSAVCIAFCLLVGAVLFLVYRSANSDILFENLQENMRSLQHGLHHQADGSWRLDPDSIGDHITYVIRDAAGNILLH